MTDSPPSGVGIAAALQRKPPKATQENHKEDRGHKLKQKVLGTNVGERHTTNGSTLPM